jgi:hypothetical protein
MKKGTYCHFDVAINFSLVVLYLTLSSQYIKMPTTNEQISKTMFGFYAICQFPRVLGAVDRSHVKIQSPGGANTELFRNRKGYFSINVQAICDAELKRLHIIARWPGAVHDSTIFNNSPLPVEFCIGQYGNGFLLGDSGYPCKPFLLTPLLHPANASREAYNRAHVLTRNTIERFFGVLKCMFSCLPLELRCQLNTVLQIIVACGGLHKRTRTRMLQKTTLLKKTTKIRITLLEMH